MDPDKAKRLTKALKERGEANRLRIDLRGLGTILDDFEPLKKEDAILPDEAAQFLADFGLLCTLNQVRIEVYYRRRVSHFS